MINKTAPIIGVKKCQVCGAEFQINGYQKRKKYCDACRVEQNRVQSRERWRKNQEKLREYHKKYYCNNRKPHKYVCAICGKVNYTSHSGRRKYCWDCLLRKKSTEKLISLIAICIIL